MAIQPALTISAYFMSTVLSIAASGMHAVKHTTCGDLWFYVGVWSLPCFLMV